MPGVERSAETKGGKSSLGSGSFLFWVLLLVSEDIFGAFLAAAVGFFSFHWENISTEELPVGPLALLSCWLSCTNVQMPTDCGASGCVRSPCSGTRSDCRRVREVMPRCVFDFSPRRWFGCRRDWSSWLRSTSLPLSVSDYHTCDVKKWKKVLLSKTPH